MVRKSYHSTALHIVRPFHPPIQRRPLFYSFTAWFQAIWLTYLSALICKYEVQQYGKCPNVLACDNISFCACWALHAFYFCLHFTSFSFFAIRSKLWRFSVCTVASCTIMQIVQNVDKSETKKLSVRSTFTWLMIIMLLRFLHLPHTHGPRRDYQRIFFSLDRRILSHW